MQRPGVQSLFNFSGKTVLITGASGGIGAGIARRFSEAGANIALHYKNGKPEAEALAAELAEKNIVAQTFQADLTNEASVASMMAAVVQHFGTLDTLINNAGIFPNSSIQAMSHGAWKTMMAVNADSIFLCTREGCAAMKNARENTDSSIINIASISGMNAGPDHAHYNASKAAVISFTQSAAQEFGPHGIRVNCISPGLIARPGIEEVWPEGVARWQKKAPLARMGTPDDVADACLFLASPAAAFITGVNLPVEGGVMASPIY